MLLNNLSLFLGDSKGGGRDWTGECRARSHRQRLELQKQELKSFFGTNVSTLKEYVEVVDERLGDVFIGTYVGPGKHTRVIYF